MEIWINPACSKCHMATDLLDQAGVSYTVRRYLDDPPTAAELDALLTRLGLQPWDLARLGEPVAAELGLAGMERDRDAWIAVMVAHPVLIQRPIIVADDGTGDDPGFAGVARTPDLVETAIATRRTRSGAGDRPGERPAPAG